LAPVGVDQLEHIDDHDHLNPPVEARRARGCVGEWGVQGGVVKAVAVMSKKVPLFPPYAITRGAVGRRLWAIVLLEGPGRVAREDVAAREDLVHRPEALSAMVVCEQREQDAVLGGQQVAIPAVYSPTPSSTNAMHH